MSLPSQPPTLDPCPCGSDATYRQCCAPLHWGLKQATSAEQLVRSRFSAAFHDITDYLVTSLHPSKRPNQQAPPLPPPFAVQWLHLQILETQRGGVDDGDGSVEFIATYRRGKEIRQLHERSELVQEGGRWFYVEGEIDDQRLPVSGRNGPCWCGSGKKLKKCHGRTGASPG